MGGGGGGGLQLLMGAGIGQATDGQTKLHGRCLFFNPELIKKAT